MTAVVVGSGSALVLLTYLEGLLQGDRQQLLQPMPTGQPGKLVITPAQSPQGFPRALNLSRHLAQHVTGRHSIQHA